MRRYKKTGLLLIITGLLFLLTGCKVKDADTLYSRAKEEHGACTVVSREESEDGTVLVLHDTLQDFDYRISSLMTETNIDGTCFGQSAVDYDGFQEGLWKKILSDTGPALDEVCRSEGVQYEHAYLGAESGMYFKISTYSLTGGQSAALKCAEILQTQNLKNRLDGLSVSVYMYGGERLGSASLPEIVWISAEEEWIEYYTERAKALARTDVEYVGKAQKTFADTGADPDRVAQIMGGDYPTEPDDEVTFYYFRRKDGVEFYVCDFYYRNESGDFSWYTNYPEKQEERRVME